MLILKTPKSLTIICKVQIVKVMREREKKTAFNFVVILKKGKHTFPHDPLLSTTPVIKSLAIVHKPSPTRTKNSVMSGYKKI